MNNHERAYRMLNEGSEVGTAAQYADIEKMRALVKTHRFTFNQEYKFIAISSIIQADILGHWGFF